MSGSGLRGKGQGIPVKRDSGKTLAELEAEAKRDHPEWFDAEGKRLPTALTGVRSPGGIYIPKPGNSDKETGTKRMPKDFGDDTEIKPGFVPTWEEPVPVMRCTAKAKTTGERCGRWSLRGMTTCYAHGGTASQKKKKADEVIASARERLISMTDIAIDALEEFIKDPNAPAAVRFKAAQDVLNRSGITAVQEVSIEVSHTNPAAEVAKRLENLAITAGKKPFGLSGPGIDADDDDDEDDDFMDAELIDD